MPKKFDTTALEATIDTGSQSTPLLTRLSDLGAEVALVEGSGPELSDEIRQLLRERLRVAAIVLCAGFSVFLIYRLLAPESTESNSIFVFHIVVTLVLGLIGVSLCRKCNPSTVHLRIKELLIFGFPAAFFVAINAVAIDECAREHQTIPQLAGPWILLMFTYAMFIPNTTRRAAIVLGMIAVLPLATLIWLNMTSETCHQLLAEDQEAFVVTALMMLVGMVTGTVGTYTIGALRREAFEARQLGQYRLRRLIGAGGMGEVHLAEHQMMKRPCAIKLIHPAKAGDPKVLARFEREVRATAKLTHWNTIEIFDYGRAADGTFYYVMEYLPGMSLAELVERFGPLPPGRAIHLLRQVCGALAEAHARGLIHRDIKPGNIFAAQRGGVYDVAKLLDFGLVKPVADVQSADLTQEGTITGSPLYMSPEQAAGDVKSDERSDIYSLGGVAYFLLTGRPPFEGDKPLQVIIAHSSQEPVPPSEHGPDIPAELERIILRCLAKSPGDRFQSVAELERALAAVEVDETWDSDSAARWWADNGDLQEHAPAEVSV
ncbi:MAG: serine/threonine protein kinase [Planctomycetota bacterium]|nr:MAG: serine/threonine protein kinase [Planctomycetota bacterium]REJ93635.1 MAG: serine/threonine protein kinase [Planctomycetota bacterium]